MKPFIQCKRTTPTLFIPLAMICFGLAPMAQAVGPDTEGSISGSNNGEGVGVLVSRTAGVWNTGTGFEALNHLTSGNQNTATGLRALFSDINGGYNTATGVYSLYSNTAGFFNSATGAYSLTKNTTGNQNTANGYSALYFNTTGVGNTAIGLNALRNNTTGTFNVAVGDEAGAGIVNASNMIAIGAPGAGPFADISNTCFIGSIYNQPVSDSATAQDTYVDQYNVLGFLPSSRRVKHDIQPMDKASEAILALKPVTFKYNSDKAGRTQYGVIAEEVAEVAPDLVFRDNNGDVSTVRFEQIGMMLLNEFLKEHGRVQAQQSKIEKQEATITELRSTVAQQQKEIETVVARLKEHDSKIQKVSAQFEMSKEAPRMVSK